MKKYIVVTKFIFNSNGQTGQTQTQPITKSQALNQEKASKNYYEARKTRFTLVSIEIKQI